MVSFITHVCHGEENYRIQAQFDNYDDFLEAEEKIRERMDRKNEFVKEEADEVD